MLEYLNNAKEESVKDCVREELVDLNTIKISKSPDKTERIIKFIKDIKNPYLFRIGNIAVKVVFSDTEETLQTRMEKFVNNNLLF